MNSNGTNLRSAGWCLKLGVCLGFGVWDLELCPAHSPVTTPHPIPSLASVNRRIFIWIGVLVAIALAWGGRKAYLAYKNLVTLNVHDMDVRDVVQKIERQTWELIVVNKDVRGKVTLNVRNVPLEEVLGIIGEQTSSRATAVYPIFSSSDSFVKLRKLARGEITHNTAGWTNFATGEGGRGGRGGPGFGGPGGFGGFGGPEGLKAQDAPVTLNVVAKDLGFVALALSRASAAQVVPEDGANAVVSLQLTEVPFRSAVAKVAKHAGRKWDVFYSLQGRPDFFARFDFDDEGGRRGGRGGDGEGFRRRFRDDGDTNRFGFETNRFDTNRWAEFREQREASRDREMEARLASMTPEEKAKAEETRQQFEQMRNATPEQRQQFFEQMRNNPEIQQRFENRRISYLNNSSPEQRSNRTREMMERRARRQQQQSR